ncbi:MAG: tripartite tricarboxylate transporter substrate binding protein [Rhizobiales bacterium]|nr:tripartite tricarboxylate transporter substrate binding protein [Hyphomicrobiales bacterium]
MMFRRLYPCGAMLTVAMLAIVASPATSPALAQQYPSQPVKVVVGFAAGSGPDVIARAVSQQLSTDLGQQFYVENRPGANGTIATKGVVQSPPDGYTLMYSSSSITPTPYVYKNLSYNLLSDLAPIATIGILDGYLMLVNPSLPVKTAPEFIAYAKQNRVLYGSPGIGNALHLVAEIFKVKTGIEMDHIPYKGASEVANSLLAGNINVMFVTPPSVIGLVKGGKLRAIGYTGHKPFPELADVPLIRQQVPGFDVFGSWGMFFAPAKTPAAVVDKLNAAIQKALKTPAVANIVGRAGYVPDGRTAKETADFFRKEVEDAGEAVQIARIKPI